ncbi:MAG: restriction endonuclease subunit S, partial [Tissierellia bacterium]|nr:restriction endonuclease subunit S [Tissierellia bacterium]
MNKIDELLKNEKVEWKKLGDQNVCKSITTGLNPRKNFKLNDFNEGELSSWYITTKDYSNNEIIEFVEGKTARITEKARKLINKRSKLEINDILFSAVGTVGKIAFVEIEPNNFDVNESTFVLKPNEKNIVPKYLVYYLRSDFVQNEVKKSLKGSTLAGIRKEKLENLEIPIPSIETQEKIVKILDKFTDYVTELKAE